MQHCNNIVSSLVHWFISSLVDGGLDYHILIKQLQNKPLS
jgi:hypothetical protein